MERDSGGKSRALRGVGGIGDRPGSPVGVHGADGRSTRELDRRRPREASVSGGRTFVEEAKGRIEGTIKVLEEERFSMQGVYRNVVSTVTERCWDAR